MSSDPAGSSPGRAGRPQAVKLGLRPGQRIYLHHPPAGWDLADPPDGLTDAGPDGPADVIIAFFSAAADLKSGDLDGLARRIYPAGALWVAWPRRAGGHRSYITDNVIRDGQIADPASDDPSILGTRAMFGRMATEPRLSATALQTVGVKGYDGFALALVVGN